MSRENTKRYEIQLKKGDAMKQAISMEKVAAALKQEELGVPLEDIIKEMGVSRETYLRWRQGHVATTDLEQISDPDSESDPESEPDPEHAPDIKNPGAEDDEK
ncbi:MAG TPA: hypothetical protein VNX00_00890 [Herbaspirillum sp.]|nr:hypothetical protein [Herbaspirillum sp.]